ncbi:MAG: DUF1592 domain-containing protein [Verrucomicrobiales bacterium]|nr:DUF1592 domain-containing protein [Verrucomicrobiales bacterium]
MFIRRFHPGALATLLLFSGFLCSLRAGEELVLDVFQKNCIQCHGQDGKVKGKVDLREIKSVEDLTADPELLQTLVDVIDFEEMPPEDEPQIEPEKRKELLSKLDALLHQSVTEDKAYTHTPIRRMNRFQYHNAVIDLFDLKCNVFTLPERMMREHSGYFQPETGKMAEMVKVGSRPLGKSQMIEPRLAGVAAFPQDLRAEHGYDNQADHLSLSPLLMEAFLTLGQSITESKDFGARNVGIWNSFFVEPKSSEDLREEVESRLRPFLTKAFRRPVADEVLARYTDHVMHQLDSGGEFSEAMKSVAAATISSPKFLYLYDQGGDSEGVQTLDDYELASRLSFFLWGSIPDETLLKLAAEGSLQEEEVLNSEIERMLKDRKLKRFCDSFPAQWLQLERIISAVPDPEHFPKFYFSKYRDSMHMMLEPLLLFETVLIENQSITQFIDSDFTYRSGLLEEAYGVLESDLSPAKVQGSGVNRGGVTALRFDRVPISDRRNGGLITNAAVMTMTSGPERTQPITRGAWLATVIFNNPPNPPPADVPALGEEPTEEEAHLTLRERLAKHRERSDCKGCHEQIDPLGFALENYSPIGTWREVYENGRDVDMEGTLFRKHRFESVIEFKDAILAEKDRFARGLAGHLLSFALARELGPADQIALDEIAQNVAEDDYLIQTLIKEVIRSEPFQTKTIPAPSNQVAENKQG